jgi:hypothetical protein
MIRAIALSLVLLLGIGVVIPLVSEFAEAGPKKQRKYSKKKKKKIKKYSKQWWRLYRARMKRKKAIQARKRALRLRQIRLAKMRRNSKNNKPVTTNQPAAKVAKIDNSPALLPTGEVAPKTWKKNSATTSEVQFRVDDENGSQLGSASISVVGPSMGTDDNPKAKSVGGVPTTSLRRNVIDQMIRENGWVVNDFQKEIGGRKVYVVVGQAEGRGGSVQSRVFYFAEVDGRIYSVSTNSPNDTTEKIAEESEKVINMLVRRRDTQRAGLK